MSYFLYLLTRTFSLLIGILPFWLLYFLSDVLRFVLLNVLGYRKAVVEDNLRKCFPDKSDAWIKRLIRLSYKNLADITLESFKGFTMNERQIVARHKALNTEIIEGFFKEKRSIIFLPNHYGNWEWGSLSPSPQLKQDVVALYKPLSNKYVDRFVRRNRSRTGAFLGSIYKTARIFEDRKDKVTAYILASDQSPSNAKRSVWVQFLGRETAFLHGPEIYARKYNYPVVFVDIQRVRRGFYTMFFTILSDKPNEMKPGEITALYAKKLEEIIRQKPENWLWSHRRWKLKR
ncbi:MAG: lysophospholipid acyltransferase family protein [Bacteroidales bacterium]|nr:lysophospholipid acyltransferase family protein [Bacteroidales bacterium]